MLTTVNIGFCYDEQLNTIDVVSLIDMSLTATLEILKIQLNKSVLTAITRAGALKNPAIHGTTRDNPKHSGEPAPDFELGLLLRRVLSSAWLTDWVHYLRS